MLSRCRRRCCGYADSRRATYLDLQLRQLLSPECIEGTNTQTTLGMPLPILLLLVGGRLVLLWGWLINKYDYRRFRPGGLRVIRFLGSREYMGGRKCPT